ELHLGPSIISVHKSDDMSRRQREASVAGGCRPRVRLTNVTNHTSKARRDIRGGVGRPIIDDNDLQRGPLLREYASDRLAQESLTIVDRDDGANHQLTGTHGLLLRTKRTNRVTYCRQIRADLEDVTRKLFHQLRHRLEVSLSCPTQLKHCARSDSSESRCRR